jgi:hypothetical protein
VIFNGKCTNIRRNFVKFEVLMEVAKEDHHFLGCKVVYVMTYPEDGGAAIAQSV